MAKKLSEIEEMKKVKESPYYFAKKYCVVDGKPFRFKRLLK
jgi:hypothetical protein